MGHLPALIHDLALILITGAITTLIFKKIKQPLVLGYIIAGFIVGPYTSITPTVMDNENIKILAEIGVIFLLFSLGLEFSFKKLMRVGGSASITAFVEIIFITIAGYFSGKWLGWSTMDSLFLGGMLASSSTTIIIRAFEELGVKTKQYARIVFGVLVVEDIVVILLMVLLSTLAVSQQFQGVELLMTVLKLSFFLLLWFITGIFLLPTLLKKAKSLLDDESLLILSIGLCLGMVVLATQVGFSAELGAFIMGSIIAETTSAEKVEKLTKPVKDLFGAVFFVSVGMLIDPQTILEYKWPVLLITLVTLFGKLFSTTLGALISGQPLKQSIQVGMSMAQIGEFAFIVATLGLSLGVISDFLFPIAVGASAITTFTTPYMIKFSGKVHDGVTKLIPKKWIDAMNQYHSGAQSIQTQSNWKKVIKSYISIALVNGIVLLALVLLSVNFLAPFLKEQFTDNTTTRIITLVISLAIAAPFLWALMAKRIHSIAYKELWLARKYNHGPLIALEIARVLIGLLFIILLVAAFFPAKISIFVAVPVITLVLIIFSKRIQTFYQRIEGRFLDNLNARELAEVQNLGNTNIYLNNPSIQSNLSPWSAYIVNLEVNPLAPYIGKTLEELYWRENYGINIVYIKRGDKLINIPKGKTRILPFDHIGVIATEEQMQVFKAAFDAKEVVTEDVSQIEDITIQKVVVDDTTNLKGVSIRNSGIKEHANGLIIGIERGTNRMLNPNSNMVFERGDIVWIVGERKRIRKHIGMVK